jgi:hypothetical protein
MASDRLTSGLTHGAGKPFLGDREVVSKILEDMVDDIYEPGQDAQDHVKRAADILTGKDPTYSPLGPSWNDDGPESGIGNWIRDRMPSCPQGGGGRKAVEFALAHLMLHHLDTLALIASGQQEPAAAWARYGRIHRNWTNMMVGIPADLGQEGE